MIARTGFFVLCSVFKEHVRSARAEGNRRPESSARTRACRTGGAGVALELLRSVDRPKSGDPQARSMWSPSANRPVGLLEFRALLAPGSGDNLRGKLLPKREDNIPSRPAPCKSPSGEPVQRGVRGEPAP